MLSRERRVALVFCDATGKLWRFRGERIPSVVRVDGERKIKNGKWSHSVWSLTLGEGVTAINLSQDFGTGRWFENWEGVNGAFPVSTPAQRREFMAAEFPQTLARIDSLAGPV